MLLENSVWRDRATSLPRYPACHSRGAASEDQHIWCLGNLCDNRSDTWCDKQHECAWQLFWDGAYSAVSKAKRGDNQALPGWASSSPRPGNEGCKMTFQITQAIVCARKWEKTRQKLYSTILWLTEAFWQKWNCFIYPLPPGFSWKTMESK